MVWFGGFQKFLNSPFGIWLLSSIVVGLLVSFSAEEQRCYTTVATFMPKLAKSASELDIRLIRIADAIYKSKSDEDADANIKSIMSGRNYIYMDYKDRNIIDIKLDIWESARALASIGQKTAIDPESLYSGLDRQLEDIADHRLGYESDFEKIRKLREEFLNRTKSEFQENLSHLGIDNSWPYVSQNTRSDLEELDKNRPCQPLYLLRDRLKLYLGIL